MDSYLRIKQQLSSFDDQPSQLPTNIRIPISQLSHFKPVKLDASLTNWSTPFKRTYLKPLPNHNPSTSPTHKLTLPRVYNHLKNASLTKIPKCVKNGEEIDEDGIPLRSRSQNAMATVMRARRIGMEGFGGIRAVEIRKVDIVSGIVMEEKGNIFDSVPKMLKRIKVLRSKSRRRKQEENVGEMSLFSLNQKIKGLYGASENKDREENVENGDGEIEIEGDGEKRRNRYYQSFLLDKSSNLLNYNI